MEPNNFTFTSNTPWNYIPQQISLNYIKTQTGSSIKIIYNDKLFGNNSLEANFTYILYRKNLTILLCTPKLAIQDLKLDMTIDFNRISSLL